MKAAAQPLPEQEPVMRRWYLTFTSFLQVFFNLSADEGPHIDPWGGVTTDEGPHIDPLG
jgi:hypothetical protein